MARIITSGIARSGSAATGSLRATDNTISSVVSNSDIVIDPKGTGVATTQSQLRITNATVSNSTTTGALTIDGGLGVSQGLYVGGSIVNAGGFSNTPVGSSSAVAGTFTTLETQGSTTLGKTAEIVGSKTGATGTVVHDFTQANTWWHSSISGNFTVNLTNTPTDDNRSYTVSFILNQGATPYVITGFSINGVSQTIRWAGYGVPTGTANARDVQTFTIIRSSSSWTIFGDAVSLSQGRDGSSAALAAESADELIQNGQTANGDYWLNLDGTPRRFFCPLAQFPGYILIANFDGGASSFLTSGPSGLFLNNANDRSSSIGDFQGPNGTYGYYRNVGAAGDRSAINSVYGYRYRYVKFRFHLYHYYSMDATNANYSPYSIGNIGDGFTVAMNNAALGNGQHIFTYFMGIQTNPGGPYNCPPTGGTSPTRAGNGPAAPSYMGNRFACSTDDSSGYDASYYGHFSGHSGGRTANPYMDGWYDVDLFDRYNNDIRSILHSDQDSGNEEPYMKRGCILVR